MTHRSITSLLLLSLSSWCHAAELRSASSRCLVIGQTTEITLQGSDLAIENNEDPQLWTSFPATMELVKPQKRDRNRVTFRITPGTDAKPGIAAIRAYNSQGVSHPLFVWLDRVPVTRGEERVELQSAQELKLPATVGGNTPDRRQLFFRFQAQAGQTLSAEVIAQRIGLDTDAVIALLDEKGRELISADDDPVLGSDCRFSLQIPTTGTYFLMLHDLQYRAGRPFLLRVGDFPLVENVFPLGMTPGKMADLEAIEIGLSRSTKLNAILGGEAFRGVREIKIDDHGPTVRVFSSTLDQFLEAEPNNDQQTATSITIPGAINGRFLARGDADFYKFSAKQGQQLTISPKTRSVSSPSFVRIKLLDGEGNVLLDSRESGINEAIQRVRIAKDGDYFLAITDILRGSGPSYGYHVLLELNRAPFTLTAPYDKKRPRHRPVAIPGGVLLVPLKVNRHGYNGPIRLTASTREGKLDVANEMIPEGKNDAGLRIRIPASLKTPTLTAILVEGYATIDGVDYSAELDVRSLVKQDFPQLLMLPPGVGERITVGIIPPTFSGKVESVTVARGGRVEIPVSIQWQSPRREPVSLVPSNLPPGCRVEKVNNLDAKNLSTKITLVTSDKTPVGTYKEVFIDMMGHIHGEEFRFELPLTVTIIEKAANNAK